MRLDFVCVGPQRAGTTWLYECLRRHPEVVFPSQVKETFFFDRQFENGYDWYWSHFVGPKQSEKLGEVAPTYFANCAACRRLHEHNPDCTIIIVLRDPVSRVFSLYLHERRKGRLTETFQNAIERKPELLEASRYSKYVPMWLERFGSSNVIPIVYEDIGTDPVAVLERIRMSLGLSSVDEWTGANERVNAGSVPLFPRLAGVAARTSDWLRAHSLYGVVNAGKRLGLKRVFGAPSAPLPQLDNTTRRALLAEFASDIAYVERLLNRKLPQWRR